MKKILIGILLVSSLFGDTCTDKDFDDTMEGMSFAMSGNFNSAVKFLVTPCANKCQGACSLLGNAYHGLKEYGKAFPVLKDACDDSRDFNMQALACQNLGHTYYFYQANKMKAIDAYLKACTMLSNGKADTGISIDMSCFNIAMIWNQTGLETRNKDLIIKAKSMFETACKYGNEKACSVTQMYDNKK